MQPAFQEWSPAEVCARSSLRGKKILVVEDSPENQLLVQLALDKMGAQVDCANNGEEGIEKALAKTYDAVIMDMQMPVLDGYSAVRQLRQRGYQTPIIALTAFAMTGDRAKCMEAGCSDYLSKPVDLRTLALTIARHIK